MFMVQGAMKRPPSLSDAKARSRYGSGECAPLTRSSGIVESTLLTGKPLDWREPKAIGISRLIYGPNTLRQ
jgi:hypothetical protein